MEAAVILLGHAVWQFDAFAYPQANVARVVDITRGGNDKMALLVVKVHALNILAKLERTHATGGPTEVVRKLLTGNGPVLGGQKR